MLNVEVGGLRSDGSAVLKDGASWIVNWAASIAGFDSGQVCHPWDRRAPARHDKGTRPARINACPLHLPSRVWRVCGIRDSASACRQAFESADYAELVLGAPSGDVSKLCRSMRAVDDYGRRLRITIPRIAHPAHAIHARFRYRYGFPPVERASSDAAQRNRKDLLGFRHPQSMHKNTPFGFALLPSSLRYDATCRQRCAFHRIGTWTYQRPRRLLSTISIPTHFHTHMPPSPHTSPVPRRS
jgi:hypothetical protein